MLSLGLEEEVVMAEEEAAEDVMVVGSMMVAGRGRILQLMVKNYSCYYDYVEEKQNID